MYNLLLAIIYLAFIGLGLPDSLLGAAWPAMYREFNAPLSLAGPIAMVISVGTIVSSLQSDRLTKLFGTGKVTALSVGLTDIALFGFSISDSVLELCLWAIPYGLGAGNVDASINNYVAVHYKSHHMSWLHCMWGLGAAVGPYIMGAVLARWRKLEYRLSLRDFDAGCTHRNLIVEHSAMEKFAPSSFTRERPRDSCKTSTPA